MVVTIIVDHLYRVAATSMDLELLLDEVVGADQTADIYPWDRPCLPWRMPGGPAHPEQRLRISTDPTAEWAALNFHSWSPDTKKLVDSLNPTPMPDAPTIPFDAEGDLWFPRTATLPLGAARDAIDEFCQSGQCPTRVHWQDGRWY